MKLAEQLEREVESIIEQGKQIHPAPDVVRARLLARARAAVAASSADPPLPMLSTAASWRGRRIALAMAAALVLVAAGAGAALHLRAGRASEVVPLARAPQAPTLHAAATSLPGEPPPGPSSGPRSQRPHRPLAPQESYAAELQLLQRAQSEYASHDFGNALVLIAEHRRRFPNGRLAEEREALRVRSLARAGRGEEARRALGSFAKRFPRSAFLPRLQEAARSADD
jgi:hypothetical protein